VASIDARTSGMTQSTVDRRRCCAACSICARCPVSNWKRYWHEWHRKTAVRRRASSVRCARISYLHSRIVSLMPSLR